MSEPVQAHKQNPFLLQNWMGSLRVLGNFRLRPRIWWYKAPFLRHPSPQEPLPHCVLRIPGFVNTLLSWKPLVPLSRVTYVCYLVHIPIMMAYYTGKTETFDFGHLEIVSHGAKFYFLCRLPLHCTSLMSTNNGVKIQTTDFRFRYTVFLEQLY